MRSANGSSGVGSWGSVLAAIAAGPFEDAGTDVSVATNEATVRGQVPVVRPRPGGGPWTRYRRGELPLPLSACSASGGTGGRRPYRNLAKRLRRPGRYALLVF